MLKSINLLPWEYRQRHNGIRTFAWGAVLLLLLLAGAVGFYSWFYVQNLWLDRSLADRAAVVAHTGTGGLSARDQVRAERVAQLETLINAVDLRPTTDVIRLMSAVTPQQVTWSSLSLEQDVVTIKGTSSGLGPLAAWMELLSTQKQVATVRLIRSAAVASATGGGTEFEITVTLAALPPLVGATHP